jgi:hypothetical protein
VAKRQPRSRSVEAATADQPPKVPEVPEVNLQLMPAATSGKTRAKAGLAGPAAALVDSVRVCYERELRLRRVTPKAKDATDVALLEAVRAGVPYQRLARVVIPPTENGDEIAGVRAQRRRVAVRFRKRVARVTACHRSLGAEATRTLPNATHADNDTVMQDRKLLYVRESYYSQDILPVDVARPVHSDEVDDDDEAELEGPDLGDDYEDDDEDEEFEG